MFPEPRGFLGHRTSCAKGETVLGKQGLPRWKRGPSSASPTRLPGRSCEILHVEGSALRGPSAHHIHCTVLLRLPLPEVLASNFPSFMPGPPPKTPGWSSARKLSWTGRPICGHLSLLGLPAVPLFVPSRVPVSRQVCWGLRVLLLSSQVVQLFVLVLSDLLPVPQPDWGRPKCRSPVRYRCPDAQPRAWHRQEQASAGYIS